MQNTLIKLIFITLLGISTTLAAFVASVSIVKACPNAVTISWIGTAGLGYNIYRSTMILNMGTFIGAVEPTVTRATDVNATPGQTYYYNIEAVDNTASDTSLIAAIAHVPSELGKPFSPTINLSNNNSIEISWTYIDNEDGVNIYRSTDFGTYFLVKDITSSLTSSWLDNTVLPGHSYSYKIAGYDECGESEASFATSTLSVPSLPDLLIDSATAFTSNDTIYGRFIVANMGNATAVPSFKIIVMCNSTIVSTWNTSGSLLSGYYYTYNFIYKTSVLTNSVIISVDNSDLIDEDNENNNLFTGTVNMALSDPIPTVNISTGPSFLNLGTTGTFSWTVACSTSQEQRIQLLKETQIIKDTIVNVSLRSYSWKPTVSDISSSCKFRILFTNLSDLIGTAEVSFSVKDVDAPTVTLKSPNGTEIWSILNEYPITWVATDNVKIIKRIISVSADSGQNWQIISDDSTNTGNYIWKNLDQVSNKALIKIMVYDAQENSATDISDAIFYLSGEPKFTSKDTVSVDANGNFNYTVTYNLPGNPPSWLLKIITKPDWITVRNDTLTGIAPSKNSIDTVKMILNAGLLNDTQSLIISVKNEITNVEISNKRKDIFGLSLINNNLYIGLNGGSQFSIIIYDVAGRQMYKSEGISTYGKIHLSTLTSSQTYLVRLFEGDRSITKRIAITK